MPRLPGHELLAHPQYLFIYPTWWFWTKDMTTLCRGLALASPLGLSVGLLVPLLSGWGLVRSVAYLVVAMGYSLGVVERVLRTIAFLRRRARAAPRDQ